MTSLEKLEYSISQSISRAEKSSTSTTSSSFKDSSYYYGNQDTPRPISK